MLPPHPPPYSPVASRLPALKGITLVSYPPLAHQNKMSVLSSIMCLQSISGAAAQPYFAENSDHARNLKAGQVAGSTVRLESGDRMWSFLDRFVNCVLPRVREWEGFNSLQAWKGDGKIVLSIDAQSVGYFPEIEPFFDSYPALYDLEIIMETSAATRGEAVSLLSGFQIPFLSREKEIETLEAEKKKEEERDPFAKFKKGRKKAGKTARGNQIVGRAR